jgi:septal ring factor EnvC (AmiA/AmiB activator)
MKFLTDWLWNKWTGRARLIIYGSLLLILFCAFWIDSCRQNRTEKKIEKIEGNIKEQEVIANVLQNQKANLQAEVNATGNNANQARENFNQAANKDSSAYDASAAEDKFCRRYPCDTSCKEWREKTGNQCE